MNTQTNKKGFTIIEVVLVLAIAALIFLMVFIAFPALARGQANTARKNDASAIAAAINTDRTNHSGTMPTTYGDISPYVDKLSQLTLPSDTTAVDSGAGAKLDTTSNADLDSVKIVTSAKCDDTNSVVAGSKRQGAVITILEISQNKYEQFCNNA
jgi:prepilin-type N-terminal cleavage/methylation domain-containing protein